MGPILGDSNNTNIWIYMVILRDFPYYDALFGLVIHHHPDIPTFWSEVPKTAWVSTCNILNICKSQSLQILDLCVKICAEIHQKIYRKRQMFFTYLEDPSIETSLTRAVPRTTSIEG